MQRGAARLGQTLVNRLAHQIVAKTLEQQHISQLERLEGVNYDPALPARQVNQHGDIKALTDHAGRLSHALRCERQLRDAPQYEVMNAGGHFKLGVIAADVIQHRVPLAAARVQPPRFKQAF